MKKSIRTFLRAIQFALYGVSVLAFYFAWTAFSNFKVVEIGLAYLSMGLAFFVFSHLFKCIEVLFFDR